MAIAKGHKLMSDNTRRLVTIQAAAEYVGCHSDTIRRRLAAKKLTRYQFAERIVRVDLDEIDEQMGVKQSGAA